VPSNAQYHHGAVRSAALDAARAAIADAGVAGLSLRAVAREIGVTHAALYRHFPDREALLAELGVSALEQLATAQRSALHRSSDPVATLENVALAYFRCAVGDPSQFRVAFVLSHKRAYPALRAAADAAEAPALAALRLAADAGAIPHNSVRSLAVSLWALVHGFSTLAIDGQLSEGQIAVDSGARTAIEDELRSAVRRVLGLATT
jgi:AcrR family transcriptional regulator